MLKDLGSGRGSSFTGIFTELAARSVLVHCSMIARPLLAYGERADCFTLTTMSEAMKVAWANLKLKGEMKKKIVKFYFKKVDGSVREAYGTLNEKLMPAITGTDNRKKNDTVQTYYDTERQEFRCFKKANLMSIA